MSGDTEALEDAGTPCDCYLQVPEDVAMAITCSPTVNSSAVSMDYAKCANDVYAI